MLHCEKLCKCEKNMGGCIFRNVTAPLWLGEPRDSTAIAS